MPTNWIDICNMALALIGGQSINSLDEPSQEARNCRKFLAQTRQSVLASHAWNCATQWALPPLLGRSGQEGKPGWPYEYAFALPGDCLRVLRIETGLPVGSPASGACRAVPFLVARHGEQRVLLCNLPSPGIVYIADTETPAILESKLRDAIIFLLAAKLALPVAEGQSLAKFFLEQYREALQEAVLADAREGYEQLPPDDSWLASPGRARGGDPIGDGGWRV